MSNYKADIVRCTECEALYSVESYACECDAPIEVFSYQHTEPREAPALLGVVRGDSSKPQSITVDGATDNAIACAEAEPDGNGWLVWFDARDCLDGKPGEIHASIGEALIALAIHFERQANPRVLIGRDAVLTVNGERLHVHPIDDPVPPHFVEGFLSRAGPMQACRSCGGVITHAHDCDRHKR